MPNPTVSRPLTPLYKVFLFGRFRIERRDPQGHYHPLPPDTWDRQSPRRVLAYLLVTPGRHTLRDTLLEALCPDDDFDRAQAVLSQALSLIRRVLVDEQGCPLLLPRKATPEKPLILAGREQLWCDWDESQDALMQAQAAEQQGKDALPLWEQAYTLCQEEFLLEERYSDWCREVRERAEGDQRLCLFRLAACYQQQGRSVDAERILRAWLSAHAFDQDALCRLMEVLAEQGRMQEALTWYQRTCEVLEEEGMEVTKHTQDLARALQAQQADSTHYVVEARVDSPISQAKEPSSASLSFPPAIRPDIMGSTSLIVPSASVTEASPAFLLRASPQLLSMEIAAGDCASWFGIKQAYILGLVHQWSSRAASCAVLQALVDREISMFDEAKPAYSDELYTLSRRQALIGIATLPTVLLALSRQGQRLVYEEFLPPCAASITACWHLLRGREFFLAEKVLSRILPFLADIAHDSSAYRKAATSLATQACRLMGIIALHHNDTAAQWAYFKRAVDYSEMADDPGLFIAALISFGYHDRDPVQAAHTYRRGLPFLDDISPLLRSRLYSELAVAHAQQQQEQKALEFLSLAKEAYPQKPEDDPSFLYADFSPSFRIMEEGRTYLELAREPSGDRHAQQAWEVFARTEHHPLEIPRIRAEIINYQAEVALALHDLDKFSHYLELGMAGAKELNSEKRKQEAVSSYRKARQLWPGEPRVQVLADLLLS